MGKRPMPNSLVANSLVANARMAIRVTSLGRVGCRAVTQAGAPMVCRQRTMLAGMVSRVTMLRGALGALEEVFASPTVRRRLRWEDSCSQLCIVDRNGNAL